MAQAKSDYIVEVIGVDKAGAVMASVAQHQEGITAATVKATAAAEKQSGVLTKLQSGWAAAAVGVYAAARAVGSLVDHLQEGGRALALDQQINAIAGAAEKVEALRSGLRGTIDTTSLQQHVILLERLGLTAQQASDVGLFALAEATRRGADTGQILERVVQALASGEVGSLKALGLTAKTTADAMLQMRDAGQQAASTLQGNVTVEIQRAKAEWGNFISDVEVTGAKLFVALGDATKYWSDELRSFYAWRRTESLVEEARKSAEIAQSQAWAEANRDLLESLGDDLRGALADVNAGIAEWAPVTLAAASATDAFTASLSRMSGVLAAVGGAGALQALIEAGARSAAGGAAGRVRVPRAGRGARGGAADSGLPAMGNFFPSANMSPFAMDAALLSGLSADTLAGATGLGGPTGNDRGNRERGYGFNPGEQLSATELAMTNFAATMLDVAQDVGEAFGGIGDAFGGMIDALTDSGAISKTGAAAKALAAVQLTALAAQAGVRAVYEFAEGLAAAARYEYWSAAQHFAASVQYGVVAGTNIAKAVSGVGGGSGARGGQDAAAMPQSGVDRERRQSGPTVIVINGPDADYSAATMRALNRAAAKGERIPVDLLSADVRRQLDRASRAA